MLKIENIEEYLYHIGLDHLEIYWTFKDEDFFFDKDVKKVCWYEIEKNFNVHKYHYKISFLYEWNKVFSYYKWMTTLTIPTKDYIIIHWTGFKLITEEEIKFFLIQFRLWKMKRFDIAADLLLDINTVLSEFKELSQRGSTFNWIGWEVETRYVWDSKKRNKRSLIRIYDKIKDIQAKKKNKNYQEYLHQPNVTRVELEIRSELAKNKYYEYLFDIQVALWIFKNYLAKQTKLFDSIEWEKITLFVKKEKVDSKNYQSTIYRDKRNKVFIWHWKSIFNMGYCPVRMLLWEWLIQESTKKFLDKDIAEAIWDLEIKIKRDEMFTLEEIKKRRHTNYTKNG